MPDYSLLAEKEVLAQLNTTPSGLTSSQAAERLQIYGLNKIREKEGINPLLLLLSQFASPIIWVLIGAMVISFFLNDIVECLVIAIVVIMIAVLGFVQEYRAESAINSLKNMLVPLSVVIRNGREQEVKSSEIVPGDLLILRNGEKIPADCVLIEERELRVNESVLTGESMEVKKQAAKGESHSDENLIFMGSYIVNGRGVVKVLHTGMNTKFGKIAETLTTIKKEETPLSKKLQPRTKAYGLVRGQAP